MNDCEFCSRIVPYNTRGRSRLLGARFIQLEPHGAICKLEMRLYDNSETVTFHTGIYEENDSNPIFHMNIPFNYCSRCGKKLQ